MKKTMKRLSLFILAVAILATVIIPTGTTTLASNSFQMRTISIVKSSRQVTDSLNGVKTYYRKGGNDGSNAFYSCAAYVKRYYKVVYNKNVFNLLCNRTPLATGDSFVRVSNPQIGDIVGMNTNHATTHWAIVKRVNEDGTITLIEQNWKWTQGGSTKSVVNRKIKVSSARFYRLKSETAVTTVSLKVGEKETIKKANDDTNTDINDTEVDTDNSVDEENTEE